MGHAYLIVAIAIFVCVCGLAWELRPRHGMHELERGNELVFYEGTLEPLPAPVELYRPRAVPDVRPAVQTLSVAPTASQAKYRCMISSIVSASWQSHHALQRTYDMLAFATVITALDRHEVSYA